MQANYTKQSLIVVAVVAGALAGVVGFGVGALLTQPEREKLHIIIADIRRQLDDSKAELRAQTAEVHQLIAANDELRTALTVRIAEIKELKFANDQIRAQLPAKIKAIKSDRITAEPGPSSDSPDVGEQGYLEGGHIFGPDNRKCVPVAMTKEILDRYVDALISNDVTAVANLYLTGEMFPVADKTKVLRLAPRGSMLSNLYKRKIRILNGEHSGKIAWVESGWVKK